ncbi:MAG: hypothetical protein HUU06_13215 [Planctomycetaceae bacterium]|nr:hypothetical protein [Planctomycetaceae bacterium]
MGNDFEPLPARVEEVVVETPTIRTFVLRPAAPVPFRAGQFLQLYVPGVGEAPFTPSSSPSEPERLEITVLRAGRVTAALHALRAGEEIGVRGPFGRGPIGAGQTRVGPRNAIAMRRHLIVQQAGGDGWCEAIPSREGGDGVGGYTGQITVERRAEITLRRVA